jgi:hypothetical protein
MEGITMKLSRQEKVFINQLVLDIKDSGIKRTDLTEERILEFAKARCDRNRKLAVFALNNPEAQAVIKVVSGANVYKKIHQQDADKWANKELELLN